MLSTTPEDSTTVPKCVVVLRVAVCNVGDMFRVVIRQCVVSGFFLRDDDRTSGPSYRVELFYFFFFKLDKWDGDESIL